MRPGGQSDRFASMPRLASAPRSREANHYHSRNHGEDERRRGCGAGRTLLNLSNRLLAMVAPPPARVDPNLALYLRRRPGRSARLYQHSAHGAIAPPAQARGPRDALRHIHMRMQSGETPIKIINMSQALARAPGLAFLGKSHAGGQRRDQSGSAGVVFRQAVRPVRVPFDAAPLRSAHRRP